MSEYRLYNNLILSPKASHGDAVAEAKRLLRLPRDTEGYVYRESLDCRRGTVKKVFSVALNCDDERLNPIRKYDFVPNGEPDTSKVPYIVGMGPCGIFCALTLLEYGIRPVIIDRGSRVEKRVADVEGFFGGAALNSESNVQYGEGGAGTFSDGKLNTGINDPRSRKVLETYVRFGADPDILYKAKPHIGTDVLRKISVNIREYILSKGGKMLFDTKLDDIVVSDGRIKGIICGCDKYDVDELVLATGNGAFDVYSMMLRHGVKTEVKPVSVGIRQEHLQSDIDAVKYGKLAGAPYLDAANYSFSTHLPNGMGLYTFCMCPGGYVVNSSSSTDGVVTNGMSYRGRDGKNANAALLVSFTPKSESDAMKVCRGIEAAGMKVGQGRTPVCTYEMLLNGYETSDKKFGKILPTVRPEGCFGDFSKVFPKDIYSALQTAAASFSTGFFGGRSFEKPVFTAPETRTSAPMRIVRDESGNSASVKGLYPCGEGAGYAGGIVSSAVDGIRIAEKIINSKDGQ